MTIRLRSDNKESVTLNSHTFYTRTVGGINAAATTLELVEGRHMPPGATAVCEVIRNIWVNSPAQLIGIPPNNPFGEKFTYTTVNANDTISTITRGALSTTADFIYNDSIIKVVDTQGDTATQDYVYVKGVSGKLAIFVAYDPTGDETGITFTVQTKSNNKPDKSAVAWHSLIESDGNAFTYTITQPGAAAAYDFVIPLHSQVDEARISIAYNGAATKSDLDLTIKQLGLEE